MASINMTGRIFLPGLQITMEDARFAMANQGGGEQSMTYVSRVLR
jgi:hypothetical protein